MTRLADAIALAEAALTTALLPAWAAVVALHPRLRGDARERLGLAVPPAPFGAVWVHAASVGEVGAAEALLAHLPGPVLLTADTDTGVGRARAVATASGGRVVAGARPVDHPWTLAPLWAEARPRAVVFVEGTYWPQLAALARRAGVPVARVSAKAGRGTRRWGWFQRIFPADLVVARDEGEAGFFGTTAVGGDLKGDRPVPPNPLRWSRPYVIGASTRPGEEEALVEAMRLVRAHVPGRPALLLAPRHPERFDAVEAALVALGIRHTRRTALVDGCVPDDVDVVVLDTIGDLAGCVDGALAAFVGGTFDAAIGGHSPAEAGRAGVPVVAGPHVHGNAAAFAAVSGIRVQHPDGLASALIEASAAPRPRPWSNGAGARTAALLRPLLRDPAPEASPRPWARVFAVVWGLAASLRPGRVERLGIPVVSIGSTNARGPGKTSTARWFARALRARGHVVGIATRGYRRARAGDDIRLSSTSADAADLGDEGALFAADGFLVAAGPDRVACGRALEAAGATVIVLDDGLQHRRLHRDVDLCVVDARYPAGRGLIPAGERREREIVPVRVDGVIVHHASATDHRLGIDVGVPVARAHRSFGPWRRGGARATAPDRPVAAFAGIGRPADFLAGVGAPVARFRALGDHQPVDAAVAAELEVWAADLPLVTTAKDHVRLPEPLRSRVWSRDVEVELIGVPDAWLPDAGVRARGSQE